MVTVKRLGLLIFDDRALTTILKEANRFFRPGAPVTDAYLSGIQGKVQLHKSLKAEEGLPIRVYGALSIPDAQELIDACSEEGDPIHFAWIDWKDDSARRVRDSELQGLLLLLRLLAYPWNTTMVWMSVHAEELDGEVASTLQDAKFVRDILGNILKSQQRFLQLPQRYPKERLWDDQDFLKLSLVPARKVFHGRFGVKARRQIHQVIFEMEAAEEDRPLEEQRKVHSKLLDRLVYPLLEETGAPGSSATSGARWSMASLFPFVIGRLRGQFSNELGTFESGSFREAADLIREVADSEQPAVGFLRQRLKNLHTSGRGEQARTEALGMWSRDTDEFERSFGVDHPKVVEWSRVAHAELSEVSGKTFGEVEERLKREIRFPPIPELARMLEEYGVDCTPVAAEGADPKSTRISCLAEDVRNGFSQMLAELKDCTFEALRIFPERPEAGQILIEIQVESGRRAFRVSNIVGKSSVAEDGLAGALRILAEYFFIEVQIGDVAFKINRDSDSARQGQHGDAASHSCRITMLGGLG